MSRNHKLTLLLLPALLFGCPDDPPEITTPEDAGTVDKDSGTTVVDDGGVLPGFGESEKANLRFKNVERLTNDVAQAMALDPADTCLELGQYDCRMVHAVALGGVEPYELGLNEPMPSTTVTTPIAAERVVVHACERRVTADLGSASPEVFALGTDPIADLEAPEVALVIDGLYKRSLLRPATEDEIAHLKQLYRDIEAAGIDNPTREWALASCVAVLTSVEMLFY